MAPTLKGTASFLLATHRYTDCDDLNELGDHKKKWLDNTMPSSDSEGDASQNPDRVQGTGLNYPEIPRGEGSVMGAASQRNGAGKLQKSHV